MWAEAQPDPVVFAILVALYTLVSLPLAWGYIVVNVATGYLYGLKYGICITVGSATLGVLIAHCLIRTFLLKCVEKYEKLLKYSKPSLSACEAFQKKCALIRKRTNPKAH